MTDQEAKALAEKKYPESDNSSHVRHWFAQHQREAFISGLSYNGEDAVRFAEWCSENMYCYDSNGNWFRDIVNWPSRMRIKSHELYSLFKQQK